MGVTNEPEAPSSTLERALAYIIVGVVALSLTAFIAVITGTALGAADGDGFEQGLWPAIVITPLFALPIAFVLIIVLLVLAALRRRRATRG